MSLWKKNNQIYKCLAIVTKIKWEKKKASKNGNGTHVTIDIKAIKMVLREHRTILCS